VIGTVWGVGDGSTTFNLPNLEDRFLTGAGNTYAIAATGGAATVTLATSEIPGHTHTGPSHTHTVNPPSTVTGAQSASHSHSGTSLTFPVGQTTGSTGHTHSGSDADSYARSINQSSHSTQAGTITGSTGTQSASHTHTVDIAQFNTGADGTGATGSSGGGGAHENRPPYAAVMFIILAASSSAGALVELYY
jgi:microcystin-dependent protein